MADAILYFLASSAGPTALFLLCAGALAAGQRLARAPREVARHERRRNELAEDCSRRALQLDRTAGARMEEIAQDANGRGVRRAGALARAGGKVYANAIREWHAHVHDSERELGRVLAGERWAHRLVRRVRGIPASALAMPADARALEGEWQSHVGRAEGAVTDPGPNAPAVVVQRLAS